MTVAYSNVLGEVEVQVRRKESPDPEALQSMAKAAVEELLAELEQGKEEERLAAEEDESKGDKGKAAVNAQPGKNAGSDSRCPRAVRLPG